MPKAAFIHCDSCCKWAKLHSPDPRKAHGSLLIVSSPEVSEPVAVRYAYMNNPNSPLLYNRDGLPAPFATDVHDAPN